MGCKARSRSADVCGFWVLFRSWGFGPNRSELWVVVQGMVMVSPEMNPTICSVFEAEIVLLFHATTFRKGFQVTVHVGNVRQTAIVEKIHGKVRHGRKVEKDSPPCEVCWDSAVSPTKARGYCYPQYLCPFLGAHSIPLPSTHFPSQHFKDFPPQQD